MQDSPWGQRETSFFYSLTPDKIFEAVEASGYRCTGRCMALNSMENRVYDVEIERSDEPPSRNKFDHYKIVKFYRPGRWTREQIQEEHDFLRDLRDNDIPVVSPEVISDGQTIAKLPDVDIFYTIFPKIGGRSPEEMTDEQIQIVGRLLARLHNVGKTRVASHRIHLNEVTYGENNLRFLIDSRMIPADLANRYEKAATTIITHSAPLFRTADVQRIHGDCHLGNLLWGPQGPFWVDFDDMVVGPPIQDIWLVTPGRDEEGRRQRNMLIEAYETMKSFDRRSLALMEPLRALRFIHFSAWISRRWKDPAFPRTFPNFNTWNYWNEQVADLEEQVQLVSQGSRYEE